MGTTETVNGFSRCWECV